MTNQTVLPLLLRHRDEAYGVFLAGLLPTVPGERIIGIRMPEYKKIIRELDSDSADAFMKSLPHYYHEENCLHVAFINQMKDFDACLAATERMIPYLDNWAVNDSLNPACFKKHRRELREHISRWIESEAPYTRRFGLHMLMVHFLGDDFTPDCLIRPAELRSDEYYVNMMTAWLFAEALVRQWNDTLPIIREQRLDPWTHNKAIQKACESYRITDEKKALLKTLKVKKQR